MIILLTLLEKNVSNNENVDIRDLRSNVSKMLFKRKRNKTEKRMLEIRATTTIEQEKNCEERFHTEFSTVANLSESYTRIGPKIERSIGVNGAEYE